MSFSHILFDCRAKTHSLKEGNLPTVCINPYLIKVFLNQGYCHAENSSLYLSYQYMWLVFYLLSKGMLYMCTFLPVYIFDMCICIHVCMYICKYNLTDFSDFSFEVVFVCKDDCAIGTDH